MSRMIQNPIDEASVLTTASHSGDASLENVHEQTCVFIEASCSLNISGGDRV